jgi:predicted DNA-binding transcriptional regulator YafY
VDVTLHSIAVDADINLDRAIESGQAQFGTAAFMAEPLTVVMACSPGMARLLNESPLSPDQSSRLMDDGRTEFTAQLPQSWELNWWLISRGPDVEVIQPPKLRQEIQAALQAALKQYEKPN